MRHFFIDEKATVGEIVHLSKEDSHHLTQVLRRSVGEKLTVSHQDRKYLGEFIGIRDQKACIRIEKELDAQLSTSKLVLCQGVVKGQKLEEIFKHATEVGVDHFIPLHMDRSVSDIRKKYHKRKDRYKKIIEEASKQCKRVNIPTLGDVVTIDEFLENKSEGQVIVPYESQESGSLTQIVDKSNKTIYYIIGPEGGFSPREAELLMDVNADFCTLGPRILRAETAAIAAGFCIKRLLESDVE